MRQNIRITPEGTRDLLFEECLARREAESLLADLFVCHGFSEVMTPGLEFFDVFQAGHPAIPAESMYKLTDSKGRLLVMRPDSTLPIARLTATRLRQAALPIRLYYAQDVYHLNHSLSGRNDQEFQAGVELIGTGGQRADLEILSLAADVLRLPCIGGDFRLEIGHIGFFQSLVEELEVGEEVRDEIRTLMETKHSAALSDLLDSLPKSGAAEALRRLPRLFGGEEILREAGPLCHKEQSRAALGHLAWLYRSLQALGLGDQVMIDLGLVHRNEYYTGVIFRGYMEGSGDTVVSGGRYDTLLQQFGSPLPATGFGVNVDAVIKGMLDKGQVEPPMLPEALVFAEDGCEAAALDKVRTLTEGGILTEFSLQETRGEALRYARERGIPLVYVVSAGGEDRVEV